MVNRKTRSTGGAKDAKVTVAIPTYNRSHLLKQALDSVLAQDFPSFRVVILDNASTDDTEAVVGSVADPRVSYVRSENNQGVLRNWNRAIEVNSSPYLTILGDDDLLLPGFIRKSARLLDRHPRVALSFSSARYVDVDRRPLGFRRAADMPAGVSEGFEWLHLAVAGRRCMINPSTVMYRAASVAAVGAFDTPHAKFGFDANLYVRLAAHFDIGFIPKELAECRVHGAQLSETAIRQGGAGMLSAMAEQIDALAYLLRSPRARSLTYRRWLTERLLSIHRRESEYVHHLAPDLAWSWEEQLRLTKVDLAALIPEGSSIAVADESQWGAEVTAGRHAIPFLERDGQYWGPPPDDETAIRELERLRCAGASNIVFGWPAFWWLDHYEKFASYLNSRFRRVFKNSRIVAYDLSDSKHRKATSHRSRPRTKRR